MVEHHYLSDNEHYCQKNVEKGCPGQEYYELFIEVERKNEGMIIKWMYVA